MKLYYIQDGKIHAKFRHLSDYSREKRTKRNEAFFRAPRSESRMRIIIFLGRKWSGQQWRCRNYTITNPDKNVPEFVGVSSVSKNVGPLSVRRRTERERGKRTYGRTDIWTKQRRFKERPRSSSLSAKIALSAGKILLSQRTTVNHRCESTKTRLAVEQKEGPDNDWPSERRKHIETRGIDAAKRRREREGEREKEGETECGDGCCCMRRMHYRITTWMAVSKFAARNRSCSAGMRREWKSGGYIHGVLRNDTPSPRKLIRLRTERNANVLSVLEKLANFESIFPRKKVWLAAIPFRQLFNFQYYIYLED